MSRPRGRSPVSARPLFAELSDLVSDLGMESPAAEPRPAAAAPRLADTAALATAAEAPRLAETAAPATAAPAATRTTRVRPPRPRTRSASPITPVRSSAAAPAPAPPAAAVPEPADEWIALERALAAAAAGRSVSWPAPTVPLHRGEQAWSLAAAAQPIPLAPPTRGPRRRGFGALLRLPGRLRGGGLRTTVSGAAVVVALGVGLIGSDFLGRHSLVRTGGPAEASVSPGMTLGGLRATAAGSEAAAAGAPGRADFTAPVNLVVVTATVSGGIRGEGLEFKVQRLAGPGEAVATAVADGLRVLGGDGTEPVSFTVTGTGGPLLPGAYQVDVFHGERDLGTAQFTVSAAGTAP